MKNLPKNIAAKTVGYLYDYESKNIQTGEPFTSTSFAFTKPTAAHYLNVRPVFTLAGTTPNTEAPSGDWLWIELMDWCKKRNVPPANYNDLFAIVDKARAALSAQQAGVQEAPSEDAKELLSKIIKLADDGFSHSMAFADLFDQARAALAAATQTEKK